MTSRRGFLSSVLGLAVASSPLGKMAATIKVDSVPPPTVTVASSEELEKFLMKMFGEFVRWHEDYSFLQGDGIVSPRIT